MKAEAKMEDEVGTTRPLGRRSVSLWPALLGLAAVVVALDQWTKHLAATHLLLGEHKPLLGPFAFERTENAGVAFGLAQGATVVISVLTVVAVIVLLVAFRRMGRGSTLVPFAFVLGGALSNLYDRLVNGRVVDFLSLPHWPSFNLADSAITVGIVWLLLRAVLQVKDSAGS